MKQEHFNTSEKIMNTDNKVHKIHAFESTHITKIYPFI